MSVILTNMDMPDSCYKCPLKTRCELAMANGWLGNKRDDNCPLRPYEERKTGRLEFMGDCWRCSVCGRFVYDNMTVDKDGKGYDFRLCPECGAEMKGAKE